MPVIAPPPLTLETPASCPDAATDAARHVSKQDTTRQSLGWILLLFLCFGFTGVGEDPAGRACSTSSRETLIKISTEREGNTTHLFVQNVQSADVTVTFEMELTNLDATVSLPYTTTLPGKKRVKLLSLLPRDPAKGWSWTYTYYSTFGTTSAHHDDSYVYSLPFAPGKSFRVSQGYNGEYSHFGPDQYAIDWRMPQGTPVYAARGGTVVGVKTDSSIGGDDSKFDWDANYVLVQHADGTLGQYVHLMKGGSKVRLGQHIEAGDWIGLSGNTGHSTGPHLHFSVFKATDGKHRQTIPVHYRTADELAVTLEEGRTYKAWGNSAALATSKSKGRTLASTDHRHTARSASELDLSSSRGSSAVGH